MRERTITLVEARNLSTAPQLALTLVWVRQYFEEERSPPPPMPDSVATLAPCDLLITETSGVDGSRHGHFKITDPDGQVRYEREWVIASARR